MTRLRGPWYERRFLPEHCGNRLNVNVNTALQNSAYLALGRVLLLKNPGFDRCAPDTIDELMAGASLARCERGDLVARIDEPFDHLCLVVEGVLEIRTLMSGRRHLMMFLAAGELTGVLCCIDGKGQLHDVIAHSDVVLMYIPGDLIRRRRIIDPDLSVALELQLAYRSRRLYELLAGTSLLSLRARLARLLVQLESGFGIHRGVADIISLRLSQTDIADLLGTSRQWANRELNELETLGMIRVKRSSIEILDLNALVELSSSG